MASSSSSGTTSCSSRSVSDGGSEASRLFPCEFCAAPQLALAPIYRTRKGNGGGTAGGLGFGGLAWREEAGDGTLSSARHSRSIWWTCSSRTAASAERLSLRADWRPQNISCRSSTRTLARSRNCRCRVDERELLLPDAGWASPPPPAAGSPAIALIKAALVAGGCGAGDGRLTRFAL